MYQYSYDRETGGLLLSDDPQLISKEPRPVYAYELDLLGFNEHWSYKSQNDAPYMWAESNSYIYRGKKIAQVKGGSLYEKPALEVVKDEFGDQVLAEDEELVPVDLKRMSEASGSRTDDRQEDIRSVQEAGKATRLFPCGLFWRQRQCCVA